MQGRANIGSRARHSGRGRVWRVKAACILRKVQLRTTKRYLRVSMLSNGEEGCSIFWYKWTTARCLLFWVWGTLYVVNSNIHVWKYPVRHEVKDAESSFDAFPLTNSIWQLGSFKSSVRRSVQAVMTVTKPPLYKSPFSLFYNIQHYRLRRSQYHSDS